MKKQNCGSQGMYSVLKAAWNLIKILYEKIILLLDRIHFQILYLYKTIYWYSEILLPKIAKVAFEYNGKKDIKIKKNNSSYEF